MASGATLCRSLRHGAKRLQPLASSVKNVRYASVCLQKASQNNDVKANGNINAINKKTNRQFHIKPRSFKWRVSKRSYSSYPEHELVRLPNLSPTMEVGTLVSWEKEEGERIEEGEVLATIETDKSTMEMETPEEGYLAKILVSGGTKDIPVNQLIAIIVSEEDDIAAFKDITDEASISASAEAAAPEPAKEEPAAPAAPAPPAAPEAQPAAPPPLPPVSATARVFASPLAKRVAMEKGVDINLVQGSGPRGRITVEDVEAFKNLGQQVVTAPPTPPPQPTPVAPTPVIRPTPTFVAPPPPPPPPAHAAYSDLELTNMRKTIAKRLTESKQNIPHYYLSVEVVMDEVLALRQEFNKNSDGNFKLSVNDFIIKASALSLLNVPECNSQWMDNFIRQFNNVDISVAVSTEGGLITPIVFDADKKGLSKINSDVKNLAEKARNKTIQPHEFMGGTFSISNLGMYGITNFSAVINPPQSCILAVGGTSDKIIPDNSERGFRNGKVMNVTLSCDHRVVDGAVGAQWLKSFRSYLEKPINMLL